MKKLYINYVAFVVVSLLGSTSGLFAAEEIELQDLDSQGAVITLEKKPQKTKKTIWSFLPSISAMKKMALSTWQALNSRASTEEKASKLATQLQESAIKVYDYITESTGKTPAQWLELIKEKGVQFVEEKTGMTLAQLQKLMMDRAIELAKKAGAALVDMAVEKVSQKTARN